MEPSLYWVKGIHWNGTGPFERRKLMEPCDCCFTPPCDKCGGRVSHFYIEVAGYRCDSCWHEWLMNYINENEKEFKNGMS